MVAELSIIFHGAAQDIGRSCFELRTKESRVLLDAGLKITEEQETFDDFPTDIENLRGIHAVFLTHAHLDHTGALPYLNSLGLSCPIFCTDMTKELAKILLEDSLKVEKLEKGGSSYQQKNIRHIMELVEPVVYGRTFRFRDLEVTFHDAGHIPGSSLIEIKVSGKRILYTGDFNTDASHLLDGAQFPPHAIDILITESTYGSREHPERDALEEDFLSHVESTLRFGGSVLIPAFGVGRAQEILLILAKKKWDVPIYVDGMAKAVSTLFLQKADVKGSRELGSALSEAIFVKGHAQRDAASKEQAIFITTSGMVNGGPVMSYLRHMHFDTKNAILLTGYQAKNTGGRMLQDTGKIEIDGKLIDVRAQVKKYDFSAHAGKSGLLKMISTLKPKHLIIIHGELTGMKALAESVQVDKITMPILNETVLL